MSDTPECDALMKNPLDSNDIYAWRRLAWHLQRQRDELAAALREATTAIEALTEAVRTLSPTSPHAVIVGKLHALLARIEEGK